MLFSESRAPARADGDDLVLLRDQDRTRWNRTMIEEGQAIVGARIRHDRPGPFRLQAAIQAVHCAADSVEATDWPEIVALYDHLYSVMPTPVVALNRAIAVADVEGPSTNVEWISLLRRATLDPAAALARKEESDEAKARDGGGSGGSAPGRTRDRRRARHAWITRDLDAAQRGHIHQ